jgi:Beta-galactosidase/beta-glucuronidase
MKKKHLLLLICFCSVQLYARVPSNSKIRLTDNWEFLKQDVGGIWEVVRPAVPESSETVPLWTRVTLPHCFNGTDAVDPDVNYYQGPSWYRTLLSVNNSYANGRILLDFEGAGQKTDVYIYTTKVGSHTGGYDEWSVDITDAIEKFMQTDTYKLQFKGKIPLSIRCDNSRDLQMIPSNLADFNVYGGLYRFVNLVYVPQVSFDQIKINSPLSKGVKDGAIEISTQFYNPLNVKEALMDLTIKDPYGKMIYTVKSQKINPAEGKYTFSRNLKRPIVWDVNSPRLYSCEMTLTVNNQKLQTTQKFGFRNFEFLENGPFLLNGKRLLLRGTHRHEDHAGVGAAMTESQIRSEMQIIKDMGVNFIRLGHYQQSDLVLQLCDELGILVWEEIPWCRGGIGGEVYKSQARRMLTNMIEQHHNHPSIIMWGLGNENDWPNDFETFEKDKIRAFMTELNQLAHHTDSSRVTSIRRCDFCKDIVDVYSPSIWAGWYKGIFTDYSKFESEEMNKVKHFFHAEWGGDSHAQRHSETILQELSKVQSRTDENWAEVAKKIKNGDWSETYYTQLIDWHLKEQERMPWLTGSAFWSFKDFSTPVRPNNPIPYVNQKGVVERDLTKKESYYVFQSYWSEKPMVHIYGHSWPIRWGDKDEQKEIFVYSNCNKVELFVNGVSQGIKIRNSQDFPAAGLRWSVLLNEGINSVKAIGITKEKKNKIIADEIQFEYQTKKWVTEAEIKLSSSKISEDTLMIEAQFIDKEGVRCLDSRKRVVFGITGDGDLIQNMGTTTGSRKIEAYNGRACIKIIRKGECVVSVKSDKIATAFIKL